jgi:hypothetical protein
MRLDIYRRKENGGRYSYLAVPATRRIPEEANAIDWEKMHDGVDFEETEEALDQFLIEKPNEQIRSKGYAITSVRNLGVPGAGVGPGLCGGKRRKRRFPSLNPAAYTKPQSASSRLR